MNTIKSGQFLYELRKEKNLSQKELADIIGVSDKAISKWELGEGFPSIEYLVKLSEFYEVTIDEIVKGQRKDIQVEQIKKNEDKKQIPIYQLISLIIGVVGLLIYIIVMYAGRTLLGSAITSLFISIITTILTILGFSYANNKLDALGVSNVLLLCLNIYLSLYSCGALFLIPQLTDNVYINGLGMVIAICSALPFLGLVGYSLVKNLSTNRSVKEMLLNNFNKYVDMLLFTLSIVSTLIFVFNLDSIRDETSAIIVLVSLIVIMLLTALDFFLKKEIPFLFPSIILVTSLLSLIFNVADLFILTVNACGMIVFVSFIIYIIIFVLKKKSKTKQTIN